MKRLRGATRSTRPLRATISVPGDKSISHRALLFAALADGRSRLSALNEGADVASTRALLRGLGVTLEESNGVVEVEGCGSNGFAEPTEPLDCGNSGTTMRAVTGVLAGAPGAFVLIGDPSLTRRPMLRVVAPLRQMGATIDGRSFGDKAPLFIRGTDLRGVEHISPIASAQVKTALLLAGLAATGTTTVTEPGPSRDHTERMLAAAGAPIVAGGNTVSVEGGARLQPLDMTVPGDASAAAFLLVAAGLVEGSDLTIQGVGVNPTRTGFLEVLLEMGADVGYTEDRRQAGEPVGTMSARWSRLTSVSVSADRVPGLIDEIPILAVAATQAQGRTQFTGVRELRVKESDRATAMTDGLRKLGARVEVGADTLTIEGPTPLHGGVVDSYGDHRIAMALAVAGLLTSEKVTIQGWSAVDVSFPGFLEALQGARGR